MILWYLYLVLYFNVEWYGRKGKFEILRKEKLIILGEKISEKEYIISFHRKKIYSQKENRGKYIEIKIHIILLFVSEKL